MGAYCLNGLHACWVRARVYSDVVGLIHFAGVGIRRSYNAECICYLLFAICYLLFAICYLLFRPLAQLLLNLGLDIVS
jgi:hypothetical protein